jgi:hypothetical protein
MAADLGIACAVADVGATVEQGVGVVGVGEESGISDEEGECDAFVSEDNIAAGVVGRCCVIDSDGIALSAFDEVDVGAFVVTFEGMVVESPSRSMISVLGGGADLTLISFFGHLRMLPRHRCCAWMVSHLSDIIVNHK